jgi:hypothetical protein
MVVIKSKIKYQIQTFICKRHHQQTVLPVSKGLKDSVLEWLRPQAPIQNVLGSNPSSSVSWLHDWGYGTHAVKPVHWKPGKTVTEVPMVK